MVFLYSDISDASDTVDQTFLLKTWCWLYPRDPCLPALSPDTSGHIQLPLFFMHASCGRPKTPLPSPRCPVPTKVGTFVPSLEFSPECETTTAPRLFLNSLWKCQQASQTVSQRSPEKRNQKETEREPQQEAYYRKWPTRSWRPRSPATYCLQAGDQEHR